MNDRVLVLAPYLLRDQAGAGQATITILNALARRYPGEVSLFTFAHDPSLFDPGLRVVDLKRPASVRFFWRFPSVFFLRQCVQHLKAAAVPTATFCYTQDVSMALAYRRLQPNVPIVSHTGAVLAHREYQDEAERPALEVAIEARLIRSMERRSYREPDWRHIVSTRLVAETRERHFNLPSGFFTVCPLAVDFARFDRFAAHEDMRARYGVPAEAFVLVTVARLIRWKNVDMILRAMSGGRERPWLFVLGAGPEEPALRDLASDLRITDRVRFVGHADPAPFLAGSDLFVLPSRIESFGMVYAEAMGMGLPCIGLRHRPPEVLSSAIDVIPEGTAGYCVDGVDELRERIDWLAANRGVVREMGDFAYRFATTNYTTERYLEMLDAVRRPPGGLS